jgi:hypothetical protein
MYGAVQTRGAVFPMRPPSSRVASYSSNSNSVSALSIVLPERCADAVGCAAPLRRNPPGNTTASIFFHPIYRDEQRA